MPAHPSPGDDTRAAREQHSSATIELFRSTKEFELDPFQRAACRALGSGSSVLVAAPTGAGKTVVAEFAVFLAQREPGMKVFYTAPMKALSNQKFQEFVEAYGPSRVGLLTGDASINPRADIVVMTTEVLRNMLYADSDLLPDLGYVVMDEVHYLADRFRGAVWEEVIIHLPLSVRLVSLSATVSNAEEFGDWLQTVRGDTAVIVSEERPVPLDQHILMRHRLIDLFDTRSSARSAAEVNPELVQLARFGGRALGGRQSRDLSRYRSRGGRQGSTRVSRPEVVRILEEHQLLPAIVFIFSRAGCDGAVEQLLRADVRLTTAEERQRIRALVEERSRLVPDTDLGVLGYWNWLDGLQRGVAAHHAGMLPAFKETVEELFRLKLLKVVFATETLALGINMPARTVMLEKLDKFNGEARVPITPGEYTQLTGRAGRRGIDVEGHAVIQWHEGLDPQAVASLASRRTYPLNSSFSPSYNMAVNLVEQFGRERTRRILESSFAQFQADRAVVGLARKVREREESLEGYANAMRCHLGDFAEYSRLRRELTDLERKGARKGQLSRGEQHRRNARLAALRAEMRRHPCHGCSDREAHSRWAERWWRLKRETDELRRQIESRTGAVARVFDRVCEVLQELDYLAVDEHGELAVTASGRLLRRIYVEHDLLVAESLRLGLWSELDPPSLAAMAAAIVANPRREEEQAEHTPMPRGPFREAFEQTVELWEQLHAIERSHRLGEGEAPTAAFSLAIARWAQGSSLDQVLRGGLLAAGDFVRLAKQTIDLLDQLSIVAEGRTGRNARQALEQLRRGIVAYTGIA